MPADGQTIGQDRTTAARPVVFQGCFGWLHPACGTHGVVLCGPIGHEALAVHRGWRALGQRLAATGLPTLRFDYAGTGDSAGAEDDPDRVDEWTTSICDAVAWLRAHTNVRTVSLVGLRMGATLAALAAPRIEDVHTLACLNPVVTGRGFLREMTLLARAWWEQVAPHQPQPAAPPGSLDVIGHRWAADTVVTLSAIDLRKLTAWPPRVILMDGGGRPDIAQLATAVRQAGRCVLIEDFPGDVAFLQDPLRAELPDAAFDRLCALFRGVQQAGPLAPATPAARLVLPGMIETPVRFGPDDALFGILCQPDPGPAAPEAVLFLNTGLTHRVGHGRLSVTLARALARQGVTSLRMDGSAIGDSEALPGQLRPRLHDAESADDIASGLDLLQSWGHATASVFGLCSGSYQAFHAARRDTRIVGLVLVNLQKFIWLGGHTLNVSYDGNRRATGIYLRAALQRHNWVRAWNGDVPVGRIARDLALRTVRAWRHRAALALEQTAGIKTRSGQLYRWMRQLSARGVRVMLIYSSADPGLADLHFHVSPARLQRELAGFTLDILPDADHCLNVHVSREALVEVLKRRGLLRQ